jgi:PhzF family phenazine biosynthesis protein
MSPPLTITLHTRTTMPMNTYRYRQLDVFAARPGDGNPLGVVPDGTAFDGAQMQAFAAWTNLSETIFLLPPTQTGADYRVRIFTPRQELPFAGHPSVGAAWAACELGLVDAGKTALVQECAAGLLPVSIESRGDARIPHVRAPRARVVAVADTDALLRDALHGWPLGALAPALWDNGPRWWLVELTDAAMLRALQPDLPTIAALTRATGAVGLAVHAHEPNDSHHLVVRAFCPADNIPEDPVTGSAQAAIAARLHAAGRVPGDGRHYVGSQGRELGRDGRVTVSVDDAGEVWIGGDVQCVIRGELRW